MGFWLNLRLKVRDFFKKHKKKITIIVIIVGIVIAIDRFLGSRPVVELPSTTYEPHSPVMDETAKVPEQYKAPINNLIDNYVNYCNNKEYENAYNLLSSDFKANYCDNIEEFKTYVDQLYKEKQIYNIQNFSNVNGAYVYRLRLLNDILATGTTDGYEYKEEKVVIKEENGVLKLALNGYVGEENLGIVAEDEYMRIDIVKKEVKYTSETYTVEITNKTGNFIVLLDNTEMDEIVMKVNGDSRGVNGLENGNLVVLPNSKKTLTLPFDQYYDDGVNP
ncbi:MAG: hypothetical protein J6D03_08940, partial [Clostridia bacterium]|nr:hypothetical protein [Clostridia bacterium]